MTTQSNPKKQVLLSLEMKNTLDKHRRQLREALASLPPHEVLDLAAAGISARPDLNAKVVHKFMKEMHEWAWSYVK